MHKMLSQYIELGNLQSAMDIFNHEIIKDVTLTNLISTPADSVNSRVLAEILRIKKQKPKKATRENKFLKFEKQYDRLILLRELRGGDLFYVFTTSSQDTRQLFKIQNITWIGANVGLFEPEYKSMYNNIPIIELQQPFLPIQNTLATMCTRPYVAEYTDKPTPRALYMEAANITITKANIIIGCGATLCDSQHESTTPCPATITEDIATRILSCRISSTEVNITRVPFQSAAFTALFLSKQAIKTHTTGPLLPVLEVRQHINSVIDYYKQHNTTWKISGWYKPGTRKNDEHVREPNFHITSIKPQQNLPNAPLYEVQQQFPREQVQVAIERPCHRPCQPPTTQPTTDSAAASNVQTNVPSTGRHTYDRMH
ncbi:uncharacterized protein LOC117108788 [Anneissia japonica]|uniref:uncharacterized protein LOC117108788 n=1 Tax=Anneissia japonica TaxID=1529436 RepID=UPI0014257945|nr:uncharacterized protein LOC117108788 [Anneissia japonica]